MFRPLTAVFLGLALGGLGGCSLPLGGLGEKSADQLITEALKDLDSANYLHVAGSLIDGQGTTLQIDVSIAKPGALQGFLAINGAHVDVLVTSGHVFYRGSGFWASVDPKVAKLFGDSWVTSPTVNLDQSLSNFTNESAFTQPLSGLRTGLQKEGTTTINGKSVIKLGDKTGTAYVTATGTARLVRVVTAPSFKLDDGSHDLNLNYDFPSPFTVSAPTAYMDTSKPETLPAHYVVESVKYGACDPSSSCEVVATVKNEAGKQAVGQPTIAISITGGGNVLGSCTLNIPPIDYNQTEDLNCSVSGSAWSGYFAGGGLKTFDAKAVPHSSPYDD